MGRSRSCPNVRLDHDARFVIWGWVTGNNVVHNFKLGDGESRTVTMPPGWWYTFYAESGGGGVPATLSGTMIKV